MKNFDQIKQTIAQQRKFLELEYSIKKIGIFGSYVHGTPTQDSDIDILVEFKKPIGLVKFLRLENYLTDLMGVKVDLVTKKALKPHIGKTILKELVNV